MAESMASGAALAGSALEVDVRGDHFCRIDATDRSTWIGRVRVDRYRSAELPGLVSSFLQCGRSHVVHFLPAHPIVLAEQDESYRDVLNRGDLNLVDGASVAVAILFQGQRCSRTTGSDALEILPAWGVESNVRHYLYGGSPEVVERLRQRLVEDHPGVEVVGAESPPYRDLSDDDIVDSASRMQATGADLVWIGLGTPKQDLVAERLRALGAAPVLLCVGAAFDFAAGAKPRAPRWIRGIGMEWLFRLASEPRRLWRRYLIGNAQFLAAVLGDFKRVGPGRRK